MVKIRSSTMFRLLCWAIGVMALGLLSLAGFMVYSYLFPSEAMAIPSPLHQPQKVVVKPVRVQQSSDAWQERFWPQETPVQGGMPSDAVDESGQVIFVGIMGDCAVFQNKSTRKQWGVWIGETGEGVRLIDIAGKIALVEINSQKVKLNKVKPMEAPVVGRGGRPMVTRGAPTGVNPAGPTGVTRPVTTPIRTTTSSSASLSSGGRTGNPSGDPVQQPAASAAAGTGSAQRFTSQPIRSTARSSGGNNGQTSGASGQSGSVNSGSNTNWRQYWADRMKARQDQQNTTNQPQPGAR